MARSRRNKLEAFERGTVLAKIVGGVGLVVSILTVSPFPAIVIGIALGVIHHIDKELARAQQDMGSKLTGREATKFRNVIHKTQNKLNGMMRCSDVAVSDEAYKLCNELQSLLHKLRDQLKNPEDVDRAAFTERISQLRAGLEQAQKAVKPTK